MCTEQDTGAAAVLCAGGGKCDAVRMRQAHAQFVGGPLDGRVLAVAVNIAERIPPQHRVPVPAHGQLPAQVLVYGREAVRGADGRRRWRYAYLGVEPARDQDPDQHRDQHRDQAPGTGAGPQSGPRPGPGAAS